MARQIAAAPATEFFINIDVIIFPVEWPFAPPLH